MWVLTVCVCVEAEWVVVWWVACCVVVEMMLCWLVFVCGVVLTLCVYVCMCVDMCGEMWSIELTCLCSMCLGVCCV